MDEKRLEKATKLLHASQEFWDACQDEGQRGAVQYLGGPNGELVIYTRFEYRDQLLKNIFSLPIKEHLFYGEQIENEDEE